MYPRYCLDMSFSGPDGFKSWSWYDKFLSLTKLHNIKYVYTYIYTTLKKKHKTCSMDQNRCPFYGSVSESLTTTGF